MIVNYSEDNEDVKFISYTGRYPNLCGGVLTLNINGKEYKFGHNYMKYNSKTNSFTDEDTPNYDRFWSSGGGITKDYDAYCEEWVINKNDLPKELHKYVAKIDEIFNENVPYGCCGGCI